MNKTVKSRFRLVAIPAILCVLSAAHAAEVAPPPAPEGQFELSGEGFFLARREIVEAQNKSETEKRLALARLNLAHGLIPEATASLNGLDQSNLTPKEAFALRHLEIELDLLSGNSTQFPMNGIPQAELWIALDRIERGEIALSLDDLRAATTKLDELPPAITAKILPILWEAATQLNASPGTLGETLAERTRALPGFEGSDLDLYLTGRMHNAAGEPAKAKRSYEQAARGYSHAAHLSRLALAELMISGRRPDYETATALLEDHRMTWRGDDDELRLLTLLARIHEETGALPEAITIMGRILRRFPESAPAKLAMQRAEVLMPRLYAAGRTGAITIEELLALHDSYIHLYDDAPVLLREWESLAIWLRGQGAAGAAAEQLAALRQHLSAHGQTHQSGQVSSLALREAEALIASGQAAEAHALLQRIGELPDPERNDLRLTLMAAALIQADTIEADLSEEPANPGPAYLRHAAEFHAASGRSAEASAYLDRLTRYFPDQATKADALGLFVHANAASEGGLAKRAGALIDEDGAGSADRGLADTMLQPSPDFSRLELQEASHQLGETENILDWARAIAAQQEISSPNRD